MNSKFNLTKAVNIFGILSCAGILLYGTIYFQQKLLQVENKSNNILTYKQKEQAESLSINTLKKMPNFGFGNLLADYSWLQFLTYFGDGEVRGKIGYSLSPDFLETIVNHDPRFVRAYFQLAPATSIFAGEAERGVNAMNQGLQSITPDLSSESYYIWTYKGVDEMMFLNDLEAARKSYETASAWAKQSEHRDAKKSAKSTKETAEFLAGNPDNLVGQIGAWTLVLNSAPDVETQDKALDKIKELGGQVIVSPSGSVRIRVPENQS